MCAECCFDECLKIEERKEAKRSRPIDVYEIERSTYINFKSDWARLKKRYRGY